MLYTQTIETTNKMYACFLRSREMYYEIYRKESDPLGILTFRFYNVPDCLIEEYYSGSPEMLLFRMIYQTREQLNKEMDKYRREQWDIARAKNTVSCDDMGTIIQDN